MGEPEMGGGDPEMDMDFGEELGGDEMGSNPNEKPFNDEPFDAGVETNEEENPEKFIQQLAGKLGQSLRSYTQELGSPDYDLEKFAINSVLSATNSGEMDNEDQSDIIKKVKNSSTDGNNDGGNNLDDGGDNLDDGGDNLDDGGDDEIDLSSIDMEESHNPNPQGQTVFQDLTLGVKDGGMEENKYLNLENTNKSGIFVKNIKDMIKENLVSKLNESPEPKVKPAEPVTKPSRRSNPFKPSRRIEENPQPKATGDDDIKYISDSGYSKINNEIQITFDVNGVRFVEKFESTDERTKNSKFLVIYTYGVTVLSNRKTYLIDLEFSDKSEGMFLEFNGFVGGGDPIIYEKK